MKPPVSAKRVGPGKVLKGDHWLNIRVSEETKRRFEEIADLGGISVSDLGRHACEDLISRGDKEGRLQIRMNRGNLSVDLRSTVPEAA
jgi:hypothetical protein